jgi:hypothetical protein
MTSILKVDTIQTAAGGTPTAADLGLNVSGNMLAVYTARGNSNEVQVNSTSPTALNVYVDVTPSSTSSKFLAIATVPLHMNPNNDGCGTVYGIRANGADIEIHGGTVLNEYANIPMWVTHSITVQGVHSPNTTSTVRYELYGNQDSTKSGTTAVFSPNHFADNTGGRPTLTVIEIAG